MPAKQAKPLTIRNGASDALDVLCKQHKVTRIDFVSYLVLSVSTLDNDTVSGFLSIGKFQQSYNEIMGTGVPGSDDLTDEQIKAIMNRTFGKIAGSTVQRQKSE